MLTSPECLLADPVALIEDKTTEIIDELIDSIPDPKQLDPRRASWDHCKIHLGARRQFHLLDDGHGHRRQGRSSRVPSCWIACTRKCATAIPR